MTVAKELPLPPTRSKLGEYVLGPRPQQHDGIGRLLRIVLVHTCGLLIMGLTSLAGWIPAWQVAVMLGYFGTSWLVFYTLMRSGWSARLADSSLDTAITMSGMGSIVAIYVMMDVGRSLALQLVCVVLVMHIDRLRLRQAMLITFGAVVALVSALVALWWFTPDRVDLRIEAYNLALATVLLPIAGFLIGETHRVSSRAKQHSGALTATLDGLRGQSLQDEVTELPNQRHMTNLMMGEIKRQGRTGRAFSLTCFDVAISGAELSGEARDDVQRQIAQLAGKFVDPADTLASWSNGRLLLMQPAMPLPAVPTTTDRLRQAVREYGWSRFDKNLRVTLSAGSAEHQFTDSLDVTLERVERALQRARQNGPDNSATDPDLPTRRELSATSGVQDEAAVLQAETVSTTPSAPMRRRMRPVMRVADGGPSSVREPGNPMPEWLVRWWLGLTDLLLGADPALRERLRLPLTGSLVYALWMILLHAYALPNDMVAPGFARWLTAGDVIGMLAFYPLIRSGWSARCTYPSLILPQVLYGCGICAISFVTTPDFRPVALQIMCFVQLFGMATLTARQTRVMAASTIAMQLGALLWVWAARSNDRHILIEAFTVGTSCFIVACISLRSFRFSQVRQQVQREQGALVRAVDRIRSQLAVDALTGLFNRQHMDDQLSREIARHRRTGQGFCVAMIGIDPLARGLRYGGSVTDDLLARFGQIAPTTLRQTDLLARWSDQTFLALLPDTETGTQGVMGLERLRLQVAARLAPEADLDSRVTLSCGIAEFRAGEPVARLLARAERGLYTARASGGNRCVLAD